MSALRIIVSFLLTLLLLHSQTTQSFQSFHAFLPTKGASRSLSFLKSNSESSPESYLSSSTRSSLDLSLLPPSYYPSSFPSSSIISSLLYTVPQALGIYVINEAQPFTIQGKEEDVKRYLEMKSPSIVGNDEVEEMCTITTKGEVKDPVERLPEMLMGKSEGGRKVERYITSE